MMATGCTGDILRLGHDLTGPQRVVRLLKRQQGQCQYCGLRVGVDDVLDAEGAPLGWRPDEQPVHQPGICPRALPRSGSRRGVSMTTTRVLRSRMKSKLYVRFCNAGGAGDCPTDR